MLLWQLLALLHLDVVQDQSGWTTYSVLGMRHDWNCVHSRDGAFTIFTIAADIIEMQAWSAIVSLCVCECVCVVCVCVCAAHTVMICGDGLTTPLL